VLAAKRRKKRDEDKKVNPYAVEDDLAPNEEKENNVEVVDLES